MTPTKLLPYLTCNHTADAVPLYLPQQLYLKPISRVNIQIQIPQRKVMGQSISNWELMEKLRKMIKPEEFIALKATKTTMEQICFDAEVTNRSKIEKVVSKLDGKMMKLIEFNDMLRVRANVAKLDFPNKHSWDAFFRDATDMNETKPGERPDTVHISSLPIKWFVPYHLSGDDDVKPSEKIFYRVFEKFGKIRHVDIPVCDPYRHKMKSHMSGMRVHTHDDKDFFEGYVQFKDYNGFVKLMDALYGMKLLHKEDNESIMVDIKVNFDKSKHLTDASMRRRGIVRDRLMMKEKKKEEQQMKIVEEAKRKEHAEKQDELDKKSEKEKRRREREEKRKEKLLARLKVRGSDDLNSKIAKEEKKLLRAQRKLESIRLVEELFKRIKIKSEAVEPSSKRKRIEDNELSRLKQYSEGAVKSQKEKLHRAIEGRVILKSILAEESARYNYSSSESDPEIINSLKEKSLPPDKYIGAEKGLGPDRYLGVDKYLPADKYLGARNFPGGLPPDVLGPPVADMGLYQYPHNGMPYQYHPADALMHPVRGPPQPGYYPYHLRGRGYQGRGGGPSRGYPMLQRLRGNNPRARGRGRGLLSYPSELQEEYYRYFEKFLYGQDRAYRRSRSRSTSRSRSRSRSRRRSRSRSRRRSRSRSRRSYSRSYSRDRRSRSNTRRRSRSSRRSKSNARRSRSNDRSRSKARRSRSDSRRSRSYSRGRSRSKRSRSRNDKRDRSKGRDKSSPRSKSKDKTSSSCQKSPDQRSKGKRSPERRSVSQRSNHESPKHQSSNSQPLNKSVNHPSTNNQSSIPSSNRRSPSEGNSQRSPNNSTSLQKNREGSHKSVDSSGFISPSRMRNRRSKSWSFPKEGEKRDGRSWSKSKTPTP